MSSVDPEKLGATVSGLILGAAVFILYIAGLFHIPLTTGQIADGAKQLGAAASGLWFLFGLCRKIFIFAFAK